MSVDERELNSTTDAQVWARSWCEVAREIEASDDGRQVIDEGWMIAWFANAIETAKRHAYAEADVGIGSGVYVRMFTDKNAEIARLNAVIDEHHQDFWKIDAILVAAEDAEVLPPMSALLRIRRIVRPAP